MPTCSLPGQVHVGDDGTVLTKTVYDDAVVDISSATTLELIIINSNGDRVVLSGSFVTDGTDGQAYFVSTPTTWTSEGTAKEQVHLVLSSGEWWSNVSTRRVGEQL